ncbi:MAG TPA: DUF559 domain-containing protein [Arenicellales bacterium]|nr:DUF559 domain-containing protein [Arenicellales bacterium]
MDDPTRPRDKVRGDRRRYSATATRRARDLRNQLTDAERLLWAQLRDRRFMGRKFRRQVPIGPYIVDFVSIRDQLIIEADGGQHAGQCRYDATRTADLEARGFRILRFWNNEILADLDSVLEVIRRALSEAEKRRGA